jgi:UDP-N-acetylmuramoyl-L-alanyl-D-glutamate--2,6-diaminopimelate ligase
VTRILPVIGVTGTNGKTSTTHLVAAGLAESGRRVYAASTIGDSFEGQPLPQAGSFTEMVRRMKDLEHRGATAFVLECTSHALASGFAQLLRFDVAIFTNLTHEHVEQHRSWEHYLASKAQLFVVGLRPDGTAVLNAADEHALLLDEVIPPGVRRVWYAAPSRGKPLRPANLSAAATTLSESGTKIRLDGGALADRLGGTLDIGLVGDVFAENTLAAALALDAVGVAPDTIRTAFARMRGVPGRFEILTTRPIVAVDYAHTPDALARTCHTARSLAARPNGVGGRVIVVFGAGGGRDCGKRGPMGTAVGLRADIAIVTTDNPRRENPSEIADALARAARSAHRARVTIELDRRRAIETALTLASEADVVVVCGKGHERGQVAGTETVPFSDVDVVRELLGDRRGPARNRSWDPP